MEDLNDRRSLWVPLNEEGLEEYNHMNMKTVDNVKLLLIHLTIMIGLIYGYSYYYVKHKLKWEDL